MCSSSNAISVIKSNIMRRTGLVAHMGQKINAYVVLVG